MRQRGLELIDRRMASADLSRATLGDTGLSGHCTARETLRSAAGGRAHDETGRATLPYATFVR